MPPRYFVDRRRFLGRNSNQNRNIFVFPSSSSVIRGFRAPATDRFLRRLVNTRYAALLLVCRPLVVAGPKQKRLRFRFGLRPSMPVLLMPFSHFKHYVYA